jgi:two-component system phosphate regulon sensor histidine kinase PhoR
LKNFMKRPQLTFSVLIGIALLLPLLSYTIYQWTERNKDEALIQQIYDRQLNTILFSVNQYCWDKFETWTSALSDTSSTPEVQHHRICLLLKQNRPLLGVCLMEDKKATIFDEGRFSRSFKNPDEACDRVRENIEIHKEQLERMQRRAMEGYSQPLSIVLKEIDPAIDLILVPVISASGSPRPKVAGLFVDTRCFVEDVVVRKFNEMNDGNLAFATTADNGEFLFNSESETNPTFEKSESLWILPDLHLQVKIKGTTLHDLSRQRIRNHLFFLLASNLLLFAGIIILMSNVSRAVNLAKMKSDFVANVSHELRTPLALIRMYAETLEMGRIRSHEKQQRYYRTIMNECSRLTKLVNNILDFAKIESHKKEYVFQSIQPDLWLKDALSIYQFHLDQSGFELMVDMNGLYPKIFADREAITQALTNLLDNAMKFSGESRKIQISMENKNNSIVLAITDFGVGIALSDQKHLFEKFYRVGSGLIHEVKGTGLGLSLVKHIMNVHQGRVEVKSESGKGSTFTLIFPVNPELKKRQK